EAVVEEQVAEESVVEEVDAEPTEEPIETVEGADDGAAAEPDIEPAVPAAEEPATEDITEPAASREIGGSVESGTSGGVQDTSIRPALGPSSDIAGLAAGISLGLAAAGATLAAMGSGDLGTAHSIAGSEPEVVELPEGAGYESGSPYEFVDGEDANAGGTPAEEAADKAATGPDVADDEAAPAAESAARSLAVDMAEGGAHGPVGSGGLLQPGPEEGLVGGADLGDASGHTAPVVVGTIEHISSPVAAPRPVLAGADQAHMVPASVDSAGGLEETAEAEQSMASWSSPQSQISYDRSDSQESLSRALGAAMPAEDASDRGLSKRDSAIHMDKTTDEDVAVAVPVHLPVTEEDSMVPDVAAAAAPVDAARAVMSPFSTFATPAFPKYFSHAEAQQPGVDVAEREVPRTSEAGAQKAPAGRPRDVLMELNIETPHNGRQVLQLRANDNLDDKCDSFCNEFNMAELAYGMKALVRGKVERRLARRRERALQAAAAKGKQPA
ncbi:hypothetical protein LPJ61_004296, partial [Coemansia biformis]